jgi:hypothetical protein
MQYIKVVIISVVVIAMLAGFNKCNNNTIEHSRINRINESTIRPFARQRLINEFVDAKIKKMKNSKFAGHSSVGVTGGGELYKEVYNHAEKLFPEGRSYGFSELENTSYDDNWEVIYEGGYKEFYYMRMQ